MHTWKAEWDGCYPNHCSGCWTLLKDGKPVDTEIPFQSDTAYTFGKHVTRYSEDSSREYEDGMQVDEWVVEFKDWLSTIAEKCDWPFIYYAFQENDWRHGECGGCL